MTAEDIDLDISIALDKLALTSQQQPLSYLYDHKRIISKAIKEIRSKNDRPDVHRIYNYLVNRTASNKDKKSSKTLTNLDTLHQTAIVLLKYQHSKIILVPN